MSDVPTQTPMVSPDERPFSELRQMTLTKDDEIASVNQLLADGWRLLHIGQRSDATVYVLGRVPEKHRPRAGFLAPD